nr:hypothetical protein [Clostridia bacterium]
MKLCAILLCLTFMLMSCSGEVPVSADERAYADSISAIIPTVKGHPAVMSSVGELIETSKPTYIVRAKLTDRGECEASGGMITTPYTVRVSECYLGNIEAGTEFVLDASYGILDGQTYRTTPYPVLVTGSEYILFIRCEVIYGETSYVLASHTYGALRIDGDTLVNDTGFDAFGGTVDAITAEVREKGE